MVCKKCGAHLLEDDQFCPECGAKVIRKKRCPECGEALREGTRFCPSCGAEVLEKRRVKTVEPEAVSRKRDDEEEAEEKPRRREEAEEKPRRRDDAEEAPRKRSGSEAAARKRTSAEPPRKKPVPREAPRKRRDWDEDWDDDWDDDDDEEDSVDILSIMTVAVGCILLVIVAVLGFNLFQRYIPKNYDKAAEEQEEDGGEEESPEEEEDDIAGGQSLEEGQVEEEEPAEMSSGAEGTLVTIADVNIRDNPGTQGTNVIMKTKKGTSYEYVEAVEGGSWYMILLPDVDGYEYGYVSADYVEIP